MHFLELGDHEFRKTKFVEVVALITPQQSELIDFGRTVAVVQDEGEGWFLKSEFDLLPDVVAHHWRLGAGDQLGLEGDQVDQEQIPLAD